MVLKMKFLAYIKCIVQSRTITWIPNLSYKSLPTIYLGVTLLPYRSKFYILRLHLCKLKFWIISNIRAQEVILALEGENEDNFLFHFIFPFLLITMNTTKFNGITHALFEPSSNLYFYCENYLDHLMFDWIMDWIKDLSLYGYTLEKKWAKIIKIR